MDCTTEVEVSAVVTHPAGGKAKLQLEEAGIYVVFGALAWDNNATGRRGLRIQTVGGVRIVTDESNNPDGTFDEHLGGSTLIVATAALNIEMRTFQDSGGALDLLGNQEHAPRFSAAKIGIT